MASGNTGEHSSVDWVDDGTDDSDEEGGGEDEGDGTARKARPFVS